MPRCLPETRRSRRLRISPRFLPGRRRQGTGGGVGFAAASPAAADKLERPLASLGPGKDEDRPVACVARWLYFLHTSHAYLFW